MLRRILLLCMALLAVTGCESIFGKETGVRGSTPGKRENVLSTERALKADADLAAARHIDIPEPADVTDWPFSGGSLDRAKGNIALPLSPHKAWSVSIGSGSDKSELTAQPVIGGGMIFTVDSRARVAALSTTDGATVWKKDVPEPKPEDAEIAGSGLAYANGTLLVTTNYGNVIALDAPTGKTLWQKLLPAPIRSAPTIDNGRVYITSTVNVSYNMSLADGSIEWTHPGVEEPAALMGMAAPMPHGEITVIPYSSGQVVGLRILNGGTVWEENLAATRTTEGTLPAMSDIQGEVVLNGNTLYVSSHSGRLVSLDVRSGQRLWEADAGGTETPWVAGNAVFVITIENQLAALSAEDGRVFWSVDLERYTDPQDRTDPVVWTGPVLAGGKLWIANSLGKIETYDPRTGKKLDTQDASGPVFVPMLAAGRTLYILSDDGTLSAYR